MKLVLKSLLVFIAPIVIGGVGIPWVIWASSGFPGEGSHGFWLPAMFAAYVGLPFGAMTGLACLVIARSNARTKKEERERLRKNLDGIDLEKPARQDSCLSTDQADD